jgi:type VI secretion system protein ImpC
MLGGSVKMRPNCRLSRETAFHPPGFAVGSGKARPITTNFMCAKLSSASFEFGIRPEGQPTGAARGSQKRFHIAVLGDFTGRANRGLTEPPAARKLVPVDCDNFEQAFARLGARLKLPAAATGALMDLEFASVDHFHPDELLSRAAPLAQLFAARRLLLDPSTAEQGRAALQSYLGAAVAAPAAQPAPAASAGTESDDQTLGRLLGGKPSAPSAAAQPAALSPVAQFIRQAVAPHVSPAAAPWQQGALAAADLELAQKLRALLHHPDFQSLEAAWRGVNFLLRHLEAVEEIGVLLLDVSQHELAAELQGGEPAGQLPLLRLLRDRKIALIIGNYSFGQSAADLRVLSRLGEIAGELSAPFLAGAAPLLVGCDSFAAHPDPDDWTTELPPDAEAAWQALREAPQAEYVGLAAPRFLLRQPYGRSGEPIESFPFEELPGVAAHEDFLWGPPAVLCASVLNESFANQLADEETEFVVPDCGELGDLPAHKFKEDGEVAIKPYGEAWLTERAADRITARGIMPLLSRKDYNSIRVPSLHSVALPPGKLPVRWS